MHSSRSGNAVIIIIVIVAAIAIIGVLGYVLWKNFIIGNGVSGNTATSFEECKKATGSVLLETYPEQCKTIDGKTFIGPSDQAAVTPLVDYCTKGEKLCFAYPNTWKLAVEDNSVADNPGFNGDLLTLTNGDGELTLHLQSGIDGIGGTCGPDGTLTRVVESAIIPAMTGFTADEYGLESAYVAKVVTGDQASKYTANLYVTNSKQFTTKGDITDISGLCFSTLLKGRNVTLSNDYTGSGAFVFGLFSNSVGSAPVYDTLDQATSAYDKASYVEAAAILASLHYQ